jgi:hypothetical protein
MIAFPTPAAAPSEAPRKGVLTERYPRVAGQLLNPLLEMLEQCRHAFAGDLDAFLVFLVIAVRTAQHPAFRRLTPEQLLSDEIAVFPSLGTNVRSVAASIRMPRESVRRKVLWLIDRGWVARRGTGLFLTAKTYRQLVPVHAGMERLALRYFELVAASSAPPGSTHGSPS